MKKVIMSEVMKAAWAFVKENGMTLSDAMRCAWRNFKLKAMMLAGKAVRFTFLKADGTIRQALGTLAKAAINYIPNGNGKAAPDRIQRFWDLEKAAYRCFTKAALLTVNA